MTRNNWLAVLVAVLIIIGVAFAASFYSNDDRWVCQNGQWVPEGNPVEPQPTEACPTINNGNEPAGNRDNTAENLDGTDMIKITSPDRNDQVSSPIEIRGEARGGWYFEADFPVKLYGSNGQLLASDVATAQGDWMTENFVPFRASLNYELAEDADGVLVLEKDNPSGLPENYDEIRIPVRLSANPTMTTVQVYFSNLVLDPSVDCNTVYPVSRSVEQTPAMARAALEELLEGVTNNERNQGYRSNLNTGVSINSLTIIDGVARVDFSSELGRNVGGSCLVTAIRAQITETLKQFPTVDEVEISIDGRTEDILQP